MSVIDLANLDAESVRLETMGVLDVTYKNGAGKNKTAKLVCIGYGVDNKEHDFLLFVGPYGPHNKHMQRAIRATDIISVRISETQSFDRYSMKSKRSPNRIGTPTARGSSHPVWGDLPPWPVDER